MPYHIVNFQLEKFISHAALILSFVFKISSTFSMSSRDDWRGRPKSEEKTKSKLPSIVVQLLAAVRSAPCISSNAKMKKKQEKV